MKPPADGDDIMLSFYCKTPSSNDSVDCPAFYRTDRRTWMVQGERRGQQVAAQLRALKESETFCEIPDDLAELFVIMFVRERYGIDLGGAEERADLQRPHAAEAGVEGSLRG